MIDYSSLIHRLKQHTKLSALTDGLEDAIAKGLCTQRYGDLPAWYDAMHALPPITSSQLEIGKYVSIGQGETLSSEHHNALLDSLKQLIPWRKGPYRVFDIEIDTEWRSDWKWDRLAPHISSLKNKNVLDVGCGNGYHCWRMWQDGARNVIGVDPSPRFIVQFYMLKQLIDKALFSERAIDIIPIGIEHIPENIQAFDTTFSMGVLYHRRSPMDHLRDLKATLKPGGELILETLIVDGDLGYCLVPEQRYAMMNNVWFLPSIPTLESWLRKCGFTNIRTVDVTTTSLEEQRVTGWMEFQSLEDFLMPGDMTKTAEGHPAPTRAIIVANKPA